MRRSGHGTPRWLAVVASLGLVVGPQASGQEPAPERPAYSFGVIADVQYAAKPTAGARHYATSLERLERAVATLNEEDLAFTVHLGDFVDEGLESLDRLSPVFEKLRSPRHHVLGNHDFVVPRPELVKKLGMPAAYHAFALGDLRFVVLDGLAESVLGHVPGSEEAVAKARARLASLKQAGAKNAFAWNGGLGEAQRSWLKEELERARRAKARVVLFCHLPVLARASTPHHLLWDHEEVHALLRDHRDVVVAWFNGHDHAGGYANDAGQHHVTIQGMVEAPQKNAFAVVDVYADRLEIRGFGKVPRRTLPFVGREARLSVPQRGR